MDSQINAPPTKSVLLRLKSQVRFLEEGHDLLERKQELLTRLVVERLKRYRELRRQAQKALTEAYHWLSLTYMRTGRRVLRHASLACEPAVHVRILSRSYVGVEYPTVQVDRRPLEPISLFGTEPSLDETRRRMAELTEVLASLGEAETILRRMLNEQRRTQKRVNALKNRIIPQYRRRIHDIENALEEDERNTLFQIKKLRDQ